MEAKTNDQYRAFPARDRVLPAGDPAPRGSILELMTASDPLDKAVKAAEASLAVEKKAVEARRPWRASGRRRIRRKSIRSRRSGRDFEGDGSEGCVRVRADSQRPGGGGDCGSGGESLFEVQHGGAAAVDAGAETRRHDNDLRELQADVVLESAQGCGGSGITAAENPACVHWPDSFSSQHLHRHSFAAPCSL